MKKIVVIPVSILVFIVMCALIIYYFFIPHYKLIGEQNTKININSIYKDNGIVVKYRGKKIKDVSESNNIDTSTKGTYQYQYQYTVNHHKYNVTRNVIVDDIIQPSIELIGEKNIVVNYKEKYIDEGCIATDNNDGDLTPYVKITSDVNTNKFGEYTIKYEVSDKANNKAIIYRNVTVKDISSPVININRNTNSYLILGSKIDINKITAIDNYDGDVSNKVKVEGNIDTNKSGVYTIIYSVSDSFGNETKLESTINVQKKNTKGIPVLMYHFFFDDTKGEKAETVNPHNYISKTNFESQMDYLVKEKYYFPTWNELEDYIDSKIELPEKSIILTDDDGTLSFYKIALPICQKRKIPITSYVITSEKDWKNYIGEEYLIQESHTNNMHERTCNKKWNGKAMCSTEKELYEDMKTSIEKVKKTDSIAYPFGHYSDEFIKALKDNNIKLAFTVINGRVQKGSNKYILPRVRISRTTTLKQYISKVS